MTVCCKETRSHNVRNSDCESEVRDVLGEIGILIELGDFHWKLLVGGDFGFQLSLRHVDYVSEIHL